MDIMFTVDGTYILANVFITNLIHADFISQAGFSQGVVVMIIVQAKVVSYCDQHHEDISSL
jgi:hypothetical protein